MAWVYLFLAGLFEVGFTTFLKLSDGFTRAWPTILFVLCAAASFWALNKALSGVALGTAYAVWTGLGAFGTAIVGMMFFGDPATAGRILFLGMLIASIVGLKLVSASS